MKIPLYLVAVLLLAVFLATLRGAPSTENTGVDSPSGSRRPEFEYLKAVNKVAPPQDPQLLFLLMAQYSNANMQGDGAEFFSARLKGIRSSLDGRSKGVVSERHRTIAGPARIFRLVVAPILLRERHDGNSGSSQAAFRSHILFCVNTSLTAYTTRTSAIGSRTCKASTISAGPTARNSWLTTSVCRKNSSSRPWSSWPTTANMNWPLRS